MAEEISIETKGRSRYVKRITFTMRIDDEAYGAIMQYAQANHISKSKAIRELIKRGVSIGN
jgi:hypothetical protein